MTAFGPFTALSSTTCSVESVLDLAAPKFGIEANLIDPSLSVIASVILAIGVGGVGAAALRAILPGSINRVPWLPLQAPIVGAAIVACLAHGLALLGLLTRPVAIAIAFGLIVIGVLVSARSRAKTADFLVKATRHLAAMKRVDSALACALLVCLAALALSFPTDDDSMAYHFGVAISTLNTGQVPFAPEWFHSRLAGAGESVTAVGLAIGAAQFTPLLQLAALAGLLAIIAGSAADTAPSRWRTVAFLSAVSLPVLVAWSNSAKPLLLPVAMTTIAIALTIRLLTEQEPANSRNTPKIQTDSRQRILAVICGLALMAGTIRMNYLPSGALIAICATLIVGRYSGYLQSALILTIAAAFIVLPPIIWKAYSFDVSVLSAALSPLPGDLAGSQSFLEYLRTFRDSGIFFPFRLILPDSLGSITTTLGIGAVLPLFFCRAVSAEQRLWIVAAITAVCLVTITSQLNARFFLEPFFWGLIALSQRAEQQPTPTLRAAHWITRAQVLACLGLAAFGAVRLLPSTVGGDWHHKTMSSLANGYQEMLWADRQLPPNARLLLMTRHMSLAPRAAISAEWRKFADADSAAALPYLDRIRQFNADFAILRLSASRTIDPTVCEASTFAVSPAFVPATRNPLNAGSRYRAWLIRLNPETNLACVLKL